MINRRNYKNICVLLALTSISCSDSEGWMSGIPLSNEKISFTASLQEGWSGEQGSGDKSRAVKPDFPGLAREQKVLTTDEAFCKPLYLHPIETVNKTQKSQGPTTRGTMNKSQVVADFGVSANYIPNKGGVEQSLFLNNKATQNGSYWFTSSNETWPLDGSVSFYAYAPYNDASFKLKDNKTIHYKVPDVKIQPDFIVAKSVPKSFSSSSANTPVDLQFHHALTAITFSVSHDMEKGKINSITIEGVKGEGDYNYDLSDNKWALSNSTASYTVSFTEAEGKVEGNNRALTGVANDNKVLMMIPQELVGDANVTINFTPIGQGVKEASFRLGGTTWDPGRHITYVLSTTKMLNLNMGTITYPKGWKTVDKIKSSYTEGDLIGMYVVDKYNKVIEENLKFKYKGGQWTMDSGKEFKGSPQYNYFVYYPYQQGGLPGAPAKGTPNINVNSAEEFFAIAIDKWKSSKIATDQSTPEKMNACDLQIGKADGLGESGATINFGSMKHAMALAEIKLGIKTISKCTNYLPGYDATNSSNTYEWKVPVRARASSNINGYNMYKTADYSYVSIVRPGNTTFNSVQETSDVNRWKQPLSFDLESNTYASKVAESQQDGNPNKREPYTVALGDVYYSDGSISHYKDELLYGKIPVGIVVYIPAATGDDYWAERGSISDKPYIGGHGLVMALKCYGTPETGDTRANYGTACSLIADLSSLSNISVSTDITVYINSRTKVIGSGYYLSNIIETSSEAVSAAKNYKPSYTSGVTHRNIGLKDNAASRTTGWFLPSAGQLIAAFEATNPGGVVNQRPNYGANNSLRNKDGYNVTAMINLFLWNAAEAKSITEPSNNYTYFGYDEKFALWTCSNFNPRYGVILFFGGEGVESAYFNPQRKDIKHHVRPFLAF